MHSTILRIQQFSHYLLLFTRDYTALHGETPFMRMFFPARMNASILSVTGTGTTILRIVSPTSSVDLDHGPWDLRIFKMPMSDSVSPPR